MLSLLNKAIFSGMVEKASEDVPKNDTMNRGSRRNMVTIVDDEQPQQKKGCCS